MAGTVAVVLKGYPRLSETFIAQEIHALERRGLRLRLYSLRRPTEASAHPVHREIAAPVTYLPEYLKDAPFKVLRAWRRARRLPGYRAAWRAFRADLAREPTANRVRRFGQACTLAAELTDDVVRLYAHFLHTPASVARYAALMTGLPWCASAHAKDIWTTPVWDQRNKLAEADWVVACTEDGRRHLAHLAPAPGKVGLVYHGLDFARFPPPPGARPARDGRDPGDPAILLSVGRAVEKKGADDLLAALARLPADLHWRLVHVGGGTLAPALKARAARLGLAGRIAWLGAQPQERVLAEYRRADLFVLASRVAADGDRDGLPNVLLEAQSQGLVCVSTGLPGIRELIEHGATGALVPPRDPDALAATIERLIRAPEVRNRLGEAGLRRVRARFSMAAGIDALAARFGLPPAADAAQ
ncbi:MAG: glycosyltransferase family 4 protein [Kiloniellaceae bacterium]